MKSEPSEQKSGAPSPRDPDEILPEYDPALIRSGERGRYAERYARGANVVVLDPDVAAIFPDPAEVNAVLRAVAAIIRSHQPAP